MIREIIYLGWITIGFLFVSLIDNFTFKFIGFIWIIVGLFEMMSLLSERQFNKEEKSK